MVSEHSDKPRRQRATIRQGKRIRLAREARGWSGSELAEKARISKQAVSLLEGGYRAGRTATLRAIARALDVPLSSLIDDPRQQ